MIEKDTAVFVACVATAFTGVALGATASAASDPVGIIVSGAFVYSVGTWIADSADSVEVAMSGLAVGGVAGVVGSAVIAFNVFAVDKNDIAVPAPSKNNVIEDSDRYRRLVACAKIGTKYKIVISPKDCLNL